MASGQNQPSVGVVVVNWDGLQDTLDCLASLRLVEQPDLDVIVVDNGSAGDDADIIAERHPEVSLLRFERNLGFSQANNLGMRQAFDKGAEYLFVLNNDTALAPDAIALLVAALADDASAGAACPLMVFHDDPEMVWFAGASFDPSRGRSGRVTGYRQKIGSWVDELPRRIDRGAGAAMMVTREAVERAGMLDEELFWMYEDVEWSLRMREVGLATLFVPEARITHKIAGSQGGDERSPYALYFLARNHLEVCRRYAPLRAPRSLQREAVSVLVHLREAMRSRNRLAAAGSVYAGWRDYRRQRFGPRPA